MDFSKYNSSRHHYIPKYLIKGFTNQEGFVYVYDKVSDELSNKSVSPKSIFYEFDRNSVKVDSDQNVSIIEDELYKLFDNSASKIIRTLQKENPNDINFDDEFIGQIQFFIITLFWRLPYTDYAFNELLDRVKISAKGVDPEKLRYDETFRKLERYKIYSHVIEEIRKHKPKVSQFYLKLSEFGDDKFLLGDNPILFRTLLNEFYEIGYMDYLFAPSSNRILSRTNEPFGDFNSEISNAYNMYIISQSLQYVCSGNFGLLEKSVKAYRTLKGVGILFPFDKFIFDFNNGNDTKLLTKYKEFCKQLF